MIQEFKKFLYRQELVKKGVTDYIEIYIEKCHVVRRSKSVKILKYLDSLLYHFLMIKLNKSPKEMKQLYQKMLDGYIPKITENGIEYIPNGNPRRFIKIKQLLETLSNQSNSSQV